MTYTLYRLMWLFLFYSFMGWVLETLAAAAHKKRFVNRGLISGPFCILYGTSAVLMTVGLHGTGGFWLFTGTCIYAAVIEWCAGHLIEKFFHEKWWNHSKSRFNLDGYICLFWTLVWGTTGFVCIRWVNPLLIRLYGLFPSFIRALLLWGIIIILIWDAFASFIIITRKNGHHERLAATNNRLAALAARLENWLYDHAGRRIRKAYSVIENIELQETSVFAEGCDFYKIAMLFFIGAFLGDIVETIFCRITAGVWMSRSSVIWGPFSIVWGLAIAVVTLMLYRYRNRSDRFLFITGTLLGGAYEYFCSIFTEVLFGTVFWDYSDIPFNLGGRINLLFCFFWGFAAVIWFKHLYPLLSRLIEKIPVIAGKLVTWALIVFMCCNIVMSVLALTRYNQRSQGIECAYSWQTWMDTHYDNEKMELIYPNAISVD